jgi:hypothetical protein
MKVGTHTPRSEVRSVEPATSAEHRFQDASCDHATEQDMTARRGGDLHRATEQICVPCRAEIEIKLLRCTEASKLAGDPEHQIRVPRSDYERSVPDGFGRPAWGTARIHVT